MSDYEFKPFSLRDRIKSFRYAFAGIKLMVKSQHNAWIHLLATAMSGAVGFYFKISEMEWIVLIGIISGVWIAEALNTSLEFLCDVASPDFHPLVEKAKDVAAGAVLIAAIAASLIGTIIFLPYFLELFL